MKIRFIGTSGGYPTAKRGTMAMTISSEQANLLVDCGEGTYREMLTGGISPLDLTAILISHQHGDHFFGLPGLIWGMHLRDREMPLMIYGPAGLRENLTTILSVSGCRPSFQLEIVERTSGDSWQIADLAIECAAGIHGSMPTLAYRVSKSAAPAKSPAKNRLGARGAFVYSGDTAPCPEIEALAASAALLAHEATWRSPDEVPSQAQKHSTASEAAEIAARAGAKRLLLVHLSPKWVDHSEEILTSARLIFPETSIPADGDSYIIVD